MPSTATITSIFTFSAHTIIESNSMNINFANLRGHNIPLDPTASSSPHMTYDLGAHDHMWRGVYSQYGVMYQNTTSSIPATPTSGSMGFYFKDDGLMYSKNPSGVEFQVTNLRGHHTPLDPTTSSSPTMTYDMGTAASMWRGAYSQYGVMYQNTAGSIPAAPAAGQMAYYFKNDGLMYYKNPAGTESQMMTYIGWTTTTVTGSWSTNTTYTGKYRRMGDTMEVDVYILLAGAPTSASLDINIPLSLSIDTAKLAAGTAGNGAVDSSLVINDSGVANHIGILRYNSTTTVRALVCRADGTYTTLNSVNATVPTTFGANDEIFIKFKVPISGWT